MRRGVGTLASPSSCSRKSSPSCQGDASVPTPHNPSPAPTRRLRFPPRFIKTYPRKREKCGRVWGRLRCPCTLKDRAKGCPHHPRTGTSSAPRLHGLIGLIRHIVGTIPCSRPGACVVRLPPPPYTCSLKPMLHEIESRQIMIITWTRSLLQLPEDTCHIIMCSRNKKGLPILAKRHLIGFLQFTAWCQQKLRIRKIFFRLEAKLCSIINRLINHLVCQFDWTLLWLQLAEYFVTNFVLITSKGKTRVAKRIFDPQAVLINKVGSKTDITIRLPPGQKNLYKCHIILLPVVTDQTFKNRKAVSAANNGLRG